MRNNTLPELLVKQAAGQGSRVAMREKDLGIWKEYTWNQYLENVKIFCLGIKKLGLVRGDKLSILSENCPEWLFADLGNQSAGGISVGIYPTNSQPQVEYIINHSDSRFIVAGDQEQVDKVLAIKKNLPGLKKIIVIDTKGLRSYNDPSLISFEEVVRLGREEDQKNPRLFMEMVKKVGINDPAFIIYTSGTTGHPKGVILTHRSTIFQIISWQKASPFTKNDVLLSFLPLSHILERDLSMVNHLYVGYTINFSESIESVQQCLQEISPTFFMSVPRIIEKMYSEILIKISNTTRVKRLFFNLFLTSGLRLSQRKMNGQGWMPWHWLLYLAGYLCLYRPILDKLGLLRVRIMQIGGASVSPEMIKFFRALGVSARDIYGMTEMSGLMAIHQGDRSPPGSVGKPPPGLGFRIADDGELLFRGDSMFQGYYKDEKSTRDAIQNGWLYTGDVGKIDDDGYIYITDRKKDIIITSGGKNISPSEIEDQLKCSPFIKEAVVIGEGRKFISALIQIDPENVGNWAQNKRIAYTTFKNLSQQPEVKELINKEVDKSNRYFSRVEQIKKFILLEKELDQDDDELTATQKVRRKDTSRKYAHLIESLYE